MNPTWQKENSIKRKKNPGKYDFVDLIFFVGIALLIDLMSVIPGVGTLGIIGFRLVFYLKNVDTKLINLLMSSGGLAEVIPAISFLPCVTLFVIIVFVEVKLMERVKKVSPKAAQALETAAGAAGGDAGSVKAVAGGAATGVSGGAGAAASVGKGAVETAGGAGSSSMAIPGSGTSHADEEQKTSRTLQDGSKSASGSPVDEGEGGGESPADITPPDQVSQKLEKQQQEEVSPESAHKAEPELGGEQKSEGDKEGWQVGGLPSAAGSPIAKPKDEE